MIQGDERGDNAGDSVSSAGDLNGDGYDDAIVGDALWGVGGKDAGEAYVLFGKARGFGTVDATGRRVLDLTHLSPAEGFVIQGDERGDNAGESVSSAGDLNGDGYDDAIVGAPRGGGYKKDRRGLCAVRQGEGVRDGGRHGPPGGRPDAPVRGGRLRDSGLWLSRQGG